MKFCKNCNNFFYMSYCVSENLGIDPVLGHIKYADARTTRETPECCGMDAKWFIDVPLKNPELEIDVISEVKNTDYPKAKSIWKFFAKY